MAADQVVHFDGLVFGHPEADHPLVAAFDAGLHLVGRQRQRRGQLFAHGIIVGERFAALLGFAAQGVQLFGGVESVVGPARIDQPEGVFEVDFTAFALAVGGVGTSRADAFVDLDAAPFERFEDILFGARHETLRVGVLDAEDHHTAVLTGEKVVVEGRADAADVERPRGAGCKAHSYGSGHNDMLFMYCSVFGLSSGQTLNRKCMMSPSCTTYSLPSTPILPASRQAFSDPSVT